MSARRDLAALAERAKTDQLSPWWTERLPAGGHQARQAAVLMLFGAHHSASAPIPGTGLGAENPEDCQVVLVERSAHLADHPGQISFPGGAIDPEDSGPVTAALREATEETGVDATGVDVLGTFPELQLQVSNFVVTPVLGWWQTQSRLWAVDTSETARVIQAPIAELVAPENRFMATISRAGTVYRSPAFRVEGVTIWGFTGGVLDWLFTELGWSKDWETTREEEAPL